MKRQSAITISSLACVVVLAALLARLGHDGLRLQVQPRSDGEVDIRLLNRTSHPARFYNSLATAREGVVPDLTTIRLRDARGEVIRAPMCDPEGYWSGSLSLVRKVPVILETLPADSSLRVSTRVATLLESYPDRAALANATHAQIRCAVLLEQGVVESRTDWFPLGPDAHPVQERGK